MRNSLQRIRSGIAAKHALEKRPKPYSLEVIMHINQEARSAQLRRIVARAKTLPFYAEALMGIDPEDVSAEDVSALPLLTRSQLVDYFQQEGTDGGFLREDIAQVFLTPAPDIGRMPEYLTERDLEWQAAATAAQFDQCGIGRGDRCLVVFSYHMLAGGWLFHQGLLQLGATVLALGPADAKTVVEITEQYGFNVLVSNPSFARKIGEAGGRYQTLLAAGEPFSAVPDYRESLEALLGCQAYDAYGLSETGIVAADTRSKDGMRVINEAAVVEVLDPQTGAAVAEGEKGEIVITSLNREGMPILRFRTGDLTLRGAYDQGRLVLPRGVFGRTDSMVKVKGVKFYPKELLFILAATPGLNFRNYQIVLSRNDQGTDHAVLRVEGEASTDTHELAERIRNACGIGMNAIEVVAQVEGDMLVDERF